MHAPAHAATPVASSPRPLRFRAPSWLETLLVVAVVAALLPLFERVAALDGRHDRYASEVTAAAATPARASAEVLVAKNHAARGLLANAGWQWAGGMLLALLLLKLSRTTLPPLAGVGLALMAWAGAAWAGRVPWPFTPSARFVPGRLDAAWTGEPATFVVAMAAVGLGALVAGAFTRSRHAPARQTLASRIGFPGLVVATGVGWLLLLDLSAHGPPANRYLALYHQGHLWLALVTLTCVAFLRPWLGRALAATLALVEEAGGRIGRALGPLVGGAALAAIVMLIAALIGGLLADSRQLTSELGRLWLIFGVAWCFFLRGSPVSDAMARGGRALPSLLRYAWPLAFVAAALAATMLATRDMGPLLISAYAAGAFLAAAVAMWWHVRRGVVLAPAVLAIVLFGAWIAAITQALFAFGAVDEVTASRLENLAAPLASANDQLALVGWFRAAAPPDGFGFGAIPWCGFASTAGCAGVPAQIQSDYTFTALVGAFGWMAAWAIAIGCAAWLHRIVSRHRCVTRGEPRLARSGARVAVDPQAFLSWIAVTWVVLTTCQLAVTVAGNLAVLPLTGVTFPFVSFGMTSLVVNSALLGLSINVNVPTDA